MGTDRFVIRQQSWRYQTPAGAATDLWDWDIWVEAQPGVTLSEIDRVVYSLHPAYPSPNRIVRDRASGFRLKVRSGKGHDDTWGRFRVRVRLVRANGRPEWHEVSLQLGDAGGPPVRGLLELPGDAALEDHLRLAKRLKSKGAFGYAREVLALAEKHPAYGADAELTERLLQQHALCTYKDPLLPLDTRLVEARRLLDRCREGLAGSTDPETLGIAGAIHKRLWEVDGQRINLERAFRFYSRGYAAMVSPAGRQRSDYDGGGYTGVNAAFVADLLQQEEQAGLGDGAAGSAGAAAASRYAGEALRIRSEIVERLEKMERSDWWHHASLAEACLGLAPPGSLGYYDRAEAALRRGMTLSAVDDWERESTATQLAALVDVQSRLHGAEATRRGWSVIGALVPDNPGALERPVRGKVGLALSGGGFRASLFHIGVLGRLAELDLLRHVEVLSCVSGGSILGAHYYLELRHLLQTKTDGEITRDDYLRIVRNLEEHFRAGVQANIRVRVAASLRSNWQMLLHPRRYSRTRRTGELYEDCIFSRVSDGESAAPRWLNDLFVSPLRGGDALQPPRLDDGFSPKLHNWRRRAKVPILVLNATTLNTGRNWQFTASSMGESVSYGTGVDATERFDPVYYGEAPEGHRGIRLGHAVAASSCVPGLFDPLVLEDLYSGRMVRLVDGGVHDNQGTRALLDHDCTVLLVSDASGQMGTEADPASSSLGVVLRTNGVLQARLRVAQHQEVEARRRSRLVREEMLVHLKQELEAPTVRPRGAAQHATAAPAANPTPVTSYGIRHDVQGALASIRTDLDSFTDREAYALMTSGYRTTERALGRLPTFAALPDHRAPWRFLAVEPAMRGGSTGPVDAEGLLKHLRVGGKLGFKVWNLHPALRGLGLALLVVAAGGVARLAWLKGSITIDLRWAVVAAVVLALGFYSKAAGRAADVVMKWINLRSTLTRIAAGLGMGTLGFLLAWLHLKVFDRWFKALGRVEAQPTPAQPLPSPPAE